MRAIEREGPGKERAWERGCKRGRMGEGKGGRGVAEGGGELPGSVGVGGHVQELCASSLCLCACVCVGSVWASEHGTKRWLTWRQSSWQQRKSSTFTTSQLSQNPTDISMHSLDHDSSSVSSSRSSILFLVPKTPALSSSLLSLPPSPLHFYTLVSPLPLPHFPAFPNPLLPRLHPPPPLLL